MFAWILDLILGNIPSWVFPFMAGGGLMLYFLAGIASHIPPLRIHALIIRPIAFITFVLGVFLYGGAGVVAIQQAELLER